MSTAVASSSGGLGGERPKAQFVPDVDSFMAGKNAESVLRSLDDQHSKFKYMENSMTQRRAQLEGKLPEIEKALECVEHLIAHKDDDEPIETRFELSDTLFGTAKVSKPKTVCIWLGANVMTEYTLDAAQALLTKNRDAATSQIAALTSDLEYLHDQIVITEVSIARVYNWDVKQRRTTK